MREINNTFCYLNLSPRKKDYKYMTLKEINDEYGDYLTDRQKQRIKELVKKDKQIKQ